MKAQALVVQRPTEICFAVCAMLHAGAVKPWQFAALRRERGMSPL